MSEHRSPGSTPSRADPVRAPLRASVRQVLPNRMFRVEVEGARLLRAHLSGEARALLMRLVPGDEVLVELSPADRGECRIVGRPGGVRGR